MTVVNLAVLFKFSDAVWKFMVLILIFYSL
jgi:hypothetical protein